MTSASSTQVVAPAPNPHPSPIPAVPWTIFLLSVGILSLLVPALLVRQVANDARSDAWLLALALAVWSGFRLSLILAQGRVRLFVFFFWLFTYIFMGIAPAVQIRGNEPARTTPDISVFADSAMMWAVVLGVVMFEVGGLISRFVPVRGQQASVRAGFGQPRFRRGVSFVLLGLGVAAAAYYMQRIGLVALFTSREAVNQARREAFPELPVRSILTSTAVYTTLVAVGALVALRRDATGTLSRAVHLAAILVGVVMLSIVVNPIGSARYPSGTVVFALLVLAGAVATTARLRATLVATMLGLFFIFPIADAFRRTGGTARSGQGFFQEILGNPDYDAVWQVSNALSFWSSGLAEVGRQAVVLPFFWVPRNVWADKPTDTGVMLADFKFYSFSNLSAPLWAEAIVNGGLIGLILVFLVLGFAVHRMDLRVMEAVHSGGAWLLVGAIFPAYSLILLRGSLLQATGAVFVTVASLLLVRRPQRRRVAQEL